MTSTHGLLSHPLLIEEFLEVFFVLSGWEVSGHVSVPVVIGAFEERAFDGVPLALEVTDFTVEVFVRNVQVDSALWEVATQFLDFSNDFLVVVLASFFVERFFGHLDVSIEFLSLVPTSFDAPDVSPVSGG